MTIFDLKEGMEFRNGETCIKKIKFSIEYNKNNIIGGLFFPNNKEISRELAEKISGYTKINITDLKTDEIDVNELKNGYQIHYSIYFTSVKNSLGISVCDSVSRFVLGWC